MNKKNTNNKFLTHRQLVALFPDTVNIDVTLHTRNTEVAKRMFDKLTKEGCSNRSATQPFQSFNVDFGKCGDPEYRTVEVSICDPDNWKHLESNPETCEPADLPEPIALTEETTNNE